MLFTKKIGNFKKKNTSIKLYVLCGAKNWALREVIRNNSKVLKCGAGESWRRSGGPIMRK